MGSTFREKDKKSKFTKTIRILENIVTMFLLILLLIGFSFAVVIGFSMEPGQESLVLGSAVFFGITLGSFILLYKKWELDWDWQDKANSPRG